MDQGAPRRGGLSSTAVVTRGTVVVRGHKNVANEVQSPITFAEGTDLVAVAGEVVVADH